MWRVIAINRWQRIGYVALKYAVDDRLRVSRADAWFEARHDVSPPVRAYLEQRLATRRPIAPRDELRVTEHRNPDVRRAARLHSEETGRRHPDYRERQVIDRDHAIQNRWIS